MDNSEKEKMFSDSLQPPISLQQAMEYEIIGASMFRQIFMNMNINRFARRTVRKYNRYRRDLVTQKNIGYGNSKS